MYLISIAAFASVLALASSALSQAVGGHVAADPQPASPQPAITCTHYAIATDTNCAGLASEYHITVQQFVEYNKNVNEGCTNLVPQQSVRVFRSGRDYTWAL